jgi:hypothetical protein
VGIEFGDSADMAIAHDGTNTNVTGSLLLKGGDIRLSDTVELQLGDTSDVTIRFNGTSVIIGGAFTVALSDTQPATAGALFLRSDTGNTSDYLLAIRV